MGTLTQWGEQIAGHLPEWTHERPELDDYQDWSRYTILRHTSGCTLHLKADPCALVGAGEKPVPDNARIVFTTDWPWFDRVGRYSPRGEVHRATMSAAKGPARIAREAQSRFIADYLPEWGRQKRLLDQAVKRRRETYQIACEFRVLNGDDRPIPEDHWILEAHYVGSFTVRLYGIDIDLNGVDPEKAKAIMLFMQDKGRFIPADCLFDPDQF